VHQAY